MLSYVFMSYKHTEWNYWAREVRDAAPVLEGSTPSSRGVQDGNHSTPQWAAREEMHKVYLKSSVQRRESS